MQLLLELLEDRRLLTALRFASWNTENNPNDGNQDGYFATVLQAIGSETVQGNTTRVDLLALQETDLPGAGFDSIARIESILETLYPGVDYGLTVSSLDGGGDATGFVYDTTTLALLESVELSAGLTHNTLRGKFRPTGTSGSSDFYAYSTHLKAGTAGTDAMQRASEASLLRADADGLGAGTPIIVAGDFNVQESAELAYTTFLAPGAAQLQDPVDTPGDWHDNPAFRSVHTQDPTSGGGGMDDRFDFQLVTGEFFDGFGIDYVNGSYHAFGNNGTHTLNGPITTGTGADPMVLEALALSSDHLPVVADYEIVTSTPGVSLQPSGQETKAIEGGVFDTYSLVLNSVPAADVTITVDPDTQTDVGAGPGTSISLVFTPASAFTPQTVVVSATNDALPEGTHSSIMEHSLTTDDTDYQLVSVDDLIITVLDDDTPTIVFNELDADTQSIDMLEFVELYDGGVGNASLSGMSVVFYNGSNDSSYAAFDLDGFSTDSDGFFLLGNSALNPDITFNDNFLQNGADAIALYAADASSFPNGTGVTLSGILDAVVYDTNDADDPGLLPLLLPAQPQVNEDGNNNRAFESLSRVPDGGAMRETVSYVAGQPTPAAQNSPTPAGILVRQSAGDTDVGEGGVTDSYTLELTTFPTQDVTVTVSPGSEVDLGNGPGLPIVLTFAPGDAIIPQTVTVTAVDDDVIEGPHPSLLTHDAVSADASYHEIGIDNVVVNIADNEQPPMVSVVITEIMYNPDSDETAPGVAEWIEVVNTGNISVDLGGWFVDDEDATAWGAIPSGTMLDVHQVAVLFDEDFTTEAEFRAAWSVPPAAVVVGVAWGNLANGPSETNEILQLIDNGGSLQDEVNYDDSGDWPSDNSDGPSIYLTDVTADNNVGTNWIRSVVGTDGAATAGLPFSMEDVGSPGHVAGITPDGDFDDDGDYDCQDIDALVAEIVLGTMAPEFDLTDDGVLDLDDLSAWLAEAGEFHLGPGRTYLPGDANLDGFVDGQDFMVWNAHKFTSSSQWCSGDFNADGFVDGLDFMIWNGNKFQSSDVPAGESSAVPDSEEEVSVARRALRISSAELLRSPSAPSPLPAVSRIGADLISVRRGEQPRQGISEAAGLEYGDEFWAVLDSDRWRW